ncbi:hypothetical protein [Peribacillus sp. SCS-155]
MAIDDWENNSIHQDQSELVAEQEVGQNHLVRKMEAALASVYL